MHFLWLVWTDFLWIPRCVSCLKSHCGPSWFNGLIAFKFSWGNIITLRGSSDYAKSYYQSLSFTINLNNKHMVWSYQLSHQHSHGDLLRLTTNLMCPTLTITWTSNYYSNYNENLTWVPVQPTQHHYVTESVPSGTNAPQTPHTQYWLFGWLKFWQLCTNIIPLGALSL